MKRRNWKDRAERSSMLPMILAKLSCTLARARDMPVAT